MLSWLTKFWRRPAPQINSRDAVVNGLKLLAVFSVFYFAIFRYGAPWAALKRDVIEFFAAGSALFISWMLYWSVTEKYATRAAKQFEMTLGFYVRSFLVIYTMMNLLLGGFKSIVLAEELRFWAYYWRHFPYAVLIFAVFLYQEEKKSVIAALVGRVNEQAQKQQQGERSADTPLTEAPLLLQADGGVLKLFPTHISHISVDGHYLDIFYERGGDMERLTVRKPLAELCKELPDPPFLKIHRSHVVNLQRASKIQKAGRNYSISLGAGVGAGEYTLPISRGRLEEVLAAFEQSLGAAP